MAALLQQVSSASSELVWNLSPFCFFFNSAGKKSFKIRLD